MRKLRDMLQAEGNPLALESQGSFTGILVGQRNNKLEHRFPSPDAGTHLLCFGGFPVLGDLFRISCACATC